MQERDRDRPVLRVPTDTVPGDNSLQGKDAQLPGDALRLQRRRRRIRDDAGDGRRNLERMMRGGKVLRNPGERQPLRDTRRTEGIRKGGDMVPLVRRQSTVHRQTS